MYQTQRHTRSDRDRTGSHLRPRAEALESRELLYATLGDLWSAARNTRITYSFATDGAWMGSGPSELSQAMASEGFTDLQWKNEIRAAAAAWEAVSGINMVEVLDNGAPLGTSGNQQGDGRFGDIRIFGGSVPGGPLAYAYRPPASNGGTRAGDIVLNTYYDWSIDSDYDLQTVAIHEFGHALGLDHAGVPQGVMWGVYNGVKQTLAADDVAGIRAVYGARPSDVPDTQGGNDDAYHATNMSSWLGSAGKFSVAGLDITTNSDTDWYYVQAPSNATGSLRVTMQSSYLSSLSPRIQVYNSALQLAGWTMATNADSAYGATVTLNFNGVAPGTGVYIKAMGWNGVASGVNGVGHYALHVDFTGSSQSLVGGWVANIAEQADKGGGSLADSDYHHGVISEVARFAPNVTTAQFRATFNSSAFDWLRQSYTSPTSSDQVQAFPDVTLVSALGLLLQLRGHADQVSHLRVFDSALDLLTGATISLDSGRVRKLLKQWVESLAGDLCRDLRGLG